MGKDQEIKKLHKKVDSLHSSFTLKLEKKEKDIYTKIIDYFSNLFHEMGLYNHEEFAKHFSKSGAMLIGAEKVKKAPASPRIKKVAKKAVVKKAGASTPAVKKAAAKKVPVKAVAVKKVKKVVAKK